MFLWLTSGLFSLYNTFSLERCLLKKGIKGRVVPWLVRVEWREEDVRGSRPVVQYCLDGNGQILGILSNNLPPGIRVICEGLWSGTGEWRGWENLAEGIRDLSIWKLQKRNHRIHKEMGPKSRRRRDWGWGQKENGTLRWQKGHSALKLTGIHGGGINEADRQPSQKSLTHEETGTGWVQPASPGLSKGCQHHLLDNQDETGGLVRNLSMLWKYIEMKHNVMTSARRREGVREFEKEKKVKECKDCSEILPPWPRETDWTGWRSKTGWLESCALMNPDDLLSSPQSQLDVNTPCFGKAAWHLYFSIF